MTQHQRPHELREPRISELNENMNNFNIKVIVIKVESIQPTKDNLMRGTFRVADKTANIQLTVFGEKVKYIKVSDILYITAAYTAIFQNRLTLYNNKNKGSVVKVGEFMMVANLDKDMSEYRSTDGADQQKQQPPNQRAVKTR